MKYVKAEMTYYNRIAEAFETINVMATECLTFAIHKPLNFSFVNKWAVSHETGYLCSHFLTLKQAKLFIERAKGAIDWSQIKVDKTGWKLTRKTIKYLDEVRPILRDIRDGV